MGYYDTGSSSVGGMYVCPGIDSKKQGHMNYMNKWTWTQLDSDKSV